MSRLAPTLELETVGVSAWPPRSPAGSSSARAGYEGECSHRDRKLHVQHLSDKAVPHHITIKDPPHQGEQLQLP